jgi:hypothetical protein
MFYFENLEKDLYRMTSNRLPNYLLIMGAMNEIPEQLGLKGKHSSNMRKK